MMEDHKVEFLGEPCGQHGAYTFYRSLRYRIGKQKWATLGLGQFFDVRIAMGKNDSTKWLPAIGELQLLWFDRNHEGLKLASVRLYMLPEDLPSGRLSSHGQDEVIADDGKFVLRVNDLLHWVVAAAAAGDAPTPHPTTASPPPHPNGCQAPADCSSSSIAKCNGIRSTLDAFSASSKHTNSGVTIISYSQYCRYKSLCKRFENFPSFDVTTRPLLAAIGGTIFSCTSSQLSADSCQMGVSGIKVLFCRDTIVHEELQQHTYRLDHLAPVLKGRKRKKKATVKLVESEDSNESEISYEKSSSNLNSGCTTPSKDDYELPSPASSSSSSLSSSTKVPTTKEKGNTDEDKFLKRLFGYMKKDNTPIGRIPTLGCKEVDLFLLYQCVQSFGGYKSVVTKRLWKQVYNLLGGSTRHTGAATGTRKNYERFLLPYEKRLKNYIKKKSGKANGKANIKVDSPSECSNTLKGGRLIIRLPLKFKLTSEQEADDDDDDVASLPMSDDSDDKPLSITLVLDRENGKTAQNKKKNKKKKLSSSGMEKMEKAAPDCSCSLDVTSCRSTPVDDEESIKKNEKRMPLV